MENLKESNSFDSSIDDSIDEAYNDLYKCLEFSGERYIVSREDSKETLESMIDHFSAKEEYEKCALICSILKKYP
jgi:hypothetical protein